MPKLFFCLATNAFAQTHLKTTAHKRCSKTGESTKKLAPTADAPPHKPITIHSAVQRLPAAAFRVFATRAAKSAASQDVPRPGTTLQPLQPDVRLAVARPCG